MKSIRPWKVGIVLLCVVGVFLAACGPTLAAASGNLQPCISSTPGANEYRNVILEQVRDVYSRRFTNPDAVRNEAYSLLVDQVQRWSSSVDIHVDNGNIIRITLTYISPELTQIIILNHQLYKNSLSDIEFEKMLLSKLNEVANREELIFLMSITYSTYDVSINPEINRITLNIPMDELALVNSRNVHIRAQDVDPPLRQDIVTSRGPSSGYIAFLNGVDSTDNCVPINDRRWNTIINVSIGRVIINGTEYAHQLAWSVKYHPLVDMDNGLISPSISYPAPPNTPINHPPPQPVGGISAEQADTAYWQEMALHVWGYVTDP